MIKIISKIFFALIICSGIVLFILPFFLFGDISHCFGAHADSGCADIGILLLPFWLLGFILCSGGMGAIIIISLIAKKDASFWKKMPKRCLYIWLTIFGFFIAVSLIVPFVMYVSGLGSLIAIVISLSNVVLILGTPLLLILGISSYIIASWRVKHPLPSII